MPAKTSPSFFSVQNNHVQSCGVPPIFQQKPNQRLAYFENEHGEQFVAVFDKTEERGKLYGGDWGWDNFCEFTREAQFVQHERSNSFVFQGKILGVGEALFVQAFLNTINAFPPIKELAGA